MLVIMTEKKRKKFGKKIRLDSSTFVTETGKHTFEVETSYMWTLKWQIELFNPVKSITSSYSGDTFKIAAEVVLDGYSDKIGVYYNETQWWVRMSGTLVKDSDNRGQAWINIAKVLSMGGKQDFELWVVENEQDGLDDWEKAGIREESEESKAKQSTPEPTPDPEPTPASNPTEGPEADELPFT